MFGNVSNAGRMVKWGKVVGGTVAAAAVVAGLPAVAAAHPHHDLHVDVSVPVVVDDAGPACPVPCPPPPPVQQVARQVWVEPVYRTVCDRQWVEPVTRTVADRVWVPPVTTTAAPTTVWVPDQYAWQDGVTYDGWGRPRRCRVQVLVAAGHYETCGGGAVVVTPGYYQDVTRTEVVCPGHWQDVRRQEVVAAGHWETRVETVEVAPPPPVVVVERDRPRVDLRVRLPF